METWKVISDYYYFFASIFLVISGMSYAVTWSLHDWAMSAYREVFKGSFWTIEIPLIGFIIDANNSWIYLSLCVPIVLEIIGRIQILRASRVKIKS